MNRCRRGYADGPHGQVHFQYTTEEGQPLVLCHQAPMTSRQFDSVYGLFADQGFRAIGVDTPGFGMSDAPVEVPSVEDYAGAIAPVLDHLGIEVADVCGHHTGSMIVTAFALQHPERVRKVVIQGPGLFTDAERAEWQRMVEEKEKGYTHRPDGSHLTDLFAARWRWADEGTDPALVTRYVVEQLMGYGPFWYGHNAAFAYDHETALKALQHPTLILTNTGDVVHEQGQRARSLRPDFSYAEIEGGGVDITDQRPTEWVERIGQFLRD